MRRIQTVYRVLMLLAALSIFGCNAMANYFFVEETIQFPPPAVEEGEEPVYRTHGGVI